MLLTFSHVESSGQQKITSGCFENHQSPGKNDLAVIMFTSGSTGNPKGVMINHGSMVAAIQLQPIYLLEIAGTTRRPDEESYLAYLPAAHILELNVELMMLSLGVKIGFSSPFTLMSTSPKIPKGGKGDMVVLKPTFLSAVPLVLDRVYKVGMGELQITI